MKSTLIFVLLTMWTSPELKAQTDAPNDSVQLDEVVVRGARVVNRTDGKLIFPSEEIAHFLLGERADIENAAPYAAQDSILSLIVNNFNTIAVDLQLRIEMIAAKIQCVRAFLRICQNRGGQGIKMKRV